MPVTRQFKFKISNYNQQFAESSLDNLLLDAVQLTNNTGVTTGTVIDPAGALYAQANENDARGRTVQQLNNLNNAVRNVKQLLNTIIDDLQLNKT